MFHAGCDRRRQQTSPETQFIPAYLASSQFITLRSLAHSIHVHPGLLASTSTIVDTQADRRFRDALRVRLFLQESQSTACQSIVLLQPEIRYTNRLL